MNIKEVKALIAAADICGHVPLIKGLHGIGKSQSAEQYAKEQDLHYEPLILSLMDTGDLLGMPESEEVDGLKATLWAAPSWYSNIVNAAWPQDTKLSDLQFMDTDFQEYVLDKLQDTSKELDRASLNTLYCAYYSVPNDRLQLARQDNVRNIRGRRSLLNLDEFNRAPPDILNASLQLVLDHRLHSHELPIVNGKDTLIVAAVNPANGDYTVQEFDPALLDRFVECEVEADLNVFISDYAVPKKLNQTTIDFLLVNRDRFHFVPKDGTKGTSPRTWTRWAAFVDSLGSNPDISVMSHYAKGTLGSVVGAQFLQFYNTNNSGVTFKKVEAFIKQQLPRVPKDGIEAVAAKVGAKITKVEAITKLNYADTFLAGYFNTDDIEDNLPVLVFLYALPLENLASVLKKVQTESPKIYASLAKLDKIHNNKGLFLKLVSLKKG